MAIKIRVNVPEEERDNIVFEKQVASFEVDGGRIYIEINGVEYYFDDSTNEGIVERVPVCDCPEGLEEVAGFDCIGHAIEALA
jgi:uncharacterized protein with ACT and thioredoxin-like domain|tara:strand:+ start:400 stop:648 length:249 start_codon:yes stop_codon:yes gene_type:complete